MADRYNAASVSIRRQWLAAVSGGQRASRDQSRNQSRNTSHDHSIDKRNDQSSREPNVSSEFEFAVDLARKAGEMIARERRDADLTHSYKGGTELVTNADLAADRMISDAIREHFPDHLIISEESAPETGDVQHLDQPLWIIDPIDGTVNYAHGHLQSAVSIAHVRAGKVVLGVVFNPFVDELFHAQQGGGAFVNDTPIKVSGLTELSKALVATGFPYIKVNLEPQIARLSAVIHQCADIRRLGSAALDICWVAAGRLDGYYENLSLWDFAAARLIAQEAGAHCGHFSPLPEGVDPQFHCNDLLITTPALFDPLHALLNAAND
jgi:myo-inositol-1(or 4)-monophosphatase